MLSGSNGIAHDQWLSLGPGPRMLAQHHRARLGLWFLQGLHEAGPL